MSKASGVLHASAGVTLIIMSSSPLGVGMKPRPLCEECQRLPFRSRRVFCRDLRRVGLLGRAMGLGCVFKFHLCTGAPQLHWKLETNSPP